jgi:hypothetical protein
VEGRRSPVSFVVLVFLTVFAALLVVLVAYLVARRWM